MQTIYLDHNTNHYFVAGFPEGWDETAERAGVRQVLDSEGNLRFASSLWNVVEISRENYERMEAVARFVDACNPMWLVERRNIQKQEVKNFVYEMIRGRPRRAEPVRPFREHLSEVLHIVDPQEIPRLGENALSLARELARQPLVQQPLRRVEMMTPEALRTLQRARSDGTLTREIEEETIRQWIGLSLPVEDLDGRTFNLLEQVENMEQCARRYGELLDRCPAMKAENILERYRTENPGRNPERQDAIDLQHMVPALAYCDAVVTNDGYLRQQCERYAGETGANIVVAARLSHAVERLST